MSDRMVRWLHDELPALVARGVLDGPAAERLRRHYGAPREGSGVRRLLMVFGTLGALLIGAGVVLLLAHNWEALGRPVRAALSFALLLAGQAAAGWALVRRRGSVAWTEGAGGFLTLATGASIALISQTYQIAGDLGGLLLTTALLCVPAMYLLRSRVTAALVWVGFTAWFLGDGWRALADTRLPLLVVLLGATVPFVARLRLRQPDDTRTALFGWVAAGCVMAAGIRLAWDVGHALWIPFFAGLLASMYALDLGAERPAVPPPAWRRPLHAFGAVGTAGLLVVLGHFENWSRAGWSERGLLEDATRTGVVMLAIAAALVAYSATACARMLRARRWGEALLAGAALPATAGWLLGDGAFLAATTVALNVYALAAGLTVGIEALRDGRIGAANGGMLLVVAILASRFFDTEWSFWVRGVAFIALGAGMLAVNALLLQRRAEVRG